MIGNSLKSDILPLVSIGTAAIHIPYHTTWLHEQVELTNTPQQDYITIKNIRELLALIK